jgi:hypothetical protein
MASTPNYASTPTVGAATLSLGDSSRTAPVNAATIFPSSTLGGQVERIVITPLGTLTATVLRLFRYDGTAYHQYGDEIQINGLTAANSTPNLSTKLEAVDNPNLFPIAIPANWSLRATINDTQIAQEMSINNIALSQTTAGAGILNLNGTNVTAASTTAVAAAAAATANAPMTLTSVPYVMANPAFLSLTSASNVSTVSYKVVGRNAQGALISETIVGPNASTVYSVNVYKAILSITPTTSNAGTISAGYSTFVGGSVITSPSPIMLSSGANLSAVNFTITGLNSAGVLQTEVLAGPNVGQVQSANAYASILTIAANAAVTSGVMVGTPPILSGISIQAEGGGY